MIGPGFKKSPVRLQMPKTIAVLLEGPACLTYPPRSVQLTASGQMRSESDVVEKLSDNRNLRGPMFNLHPARLVETETLNFEIVDDNVDEDAIDCHIDDEAVALLPHDDHQPQIVEVLPLTMSGSSAQSAPQAPPVAPLSSSPVEMRHFEFNEYGRGPGGDVEWHTCLICSKRSTVWKYANRMRNMTGPHLSTLSITLRARF